VSEALLVQLLSEVQDQGSKLGGLESSVESIRREQERERTEATAFRELVGQRDEERRKQLEDAVRRFDIDTGLLSSEMSKLGSRVEGCPHHQPAAPTGPHPVGPTEAEARTGLLRSLAKLAAVFGGALAAASAYVFGGK